jgi:hypothetical protein
MFCSTYGKALDLIFDPGKFLTAQSGHQGLTPLKKMVTGQFSVQIPDFPNSSIPCSTTLTITLEISATPGEKSTPMIYAAIFVKQTTYFLKAPHK